MEETRSERIGVEAVQIKREAEGCKALARIVNQRRKQGPVVVFGQVQPNRSGSVWVRPARPRKTLSREDGRGRVIIEATLKFKSCGESLENHARPADSLDSRPFSFGFSTSTSTFGTVCRIAGRGAGASLRSSVGGGRPGRGSFARSFLSLWFGGWNPDGSG